MFHVKHRTALLTYVSRETFARSGSILRPPGTGTDRRTPRHFHPAPSIWLVTGDAAVRIKGFCRQQNGVLDAEPNHRGPRRLCHPPFRRRHPARPRPGAGRGDIRLGPCGQPGRRARGRVRHLALLHRPGRGQLLQLRHRRIQRRQRLFGRSAAPFARRAGRLAPVRERLPGHRRRAVQRQQDDARLQRGGYRARRPHLQRRDGGGARLQRGGPLYRDRLDQRTGGGGAVSPSSPMPG